MIRDGSYECDIVYTSVREARRALRLSGTTLGDRAFTVQLVTEGARFGARRASERIRAAHPEAAHQTALIQGLPSGTTEEAVVALCGGAAVAKSAVLLDGGERALVDFADRPSMLLAFERLKIATLPDGSHAHIGEAWRHIDPDHLPYKTTALPRSDGRSASLSELDDHHRRQRREEARDWHSHRSSRHDRAPRSRSRERSHPHRRRPSRSPEHTRRHYRPSHEPPHYHDRHRR